MANLPIPAQYQHLTLLEVRTEFMDDQIEAASSTTANPNTHYYIHSYNKASRNPAQSSSSSSSSSSQPQVSSSSAAPSAARQTHSHPAASSSSTRPQGQSSSSAITFPSFSSSSASSMSNSHLPLQIRQVVDGIAQVPLNARTGWPNRRLLGERFPEHFSKKGVLRRGSELQRYRHLINWPDWFWAWLEDCESA